MDPSVGGFAGLRRRERRISSAIDRIDLSTGVRSAWKEVGPPGLVGALGIPRVFLSADGQSYVYTYVRLLDELFLVDGLK